MITSEDIQSLCDSIAQTFHPEQIILFGSYANGSPNVDSDVDILVVMDHDGKNAQQAAKILTKIKPKFPVDFVVRSPEQLSKRLALNDFFLRDVVVRGRVLYAAPDQ
ncbi:MAG: nucleotidyltransferase domain-containing protein [Chthonomonadales bacterium]